MRHTAVSVIKGLRKLTIWLAFFTCRTLKCGKTILSRFVRTVDLQRCMSSKRNKTLDFRLACALISALLW